MSPLVEMPRSMWVPWEWEHRVCTCPDPTTGIWGDDFGFAGKVCSKCHKYFRWVLLKCSGCNETYLNLFAHPEHCPHTNRCLKCCLNGYSNTCEQGCYRHEFYDYRMDADRAPRPIPNLQSMLDSDITFDF